MLYVALALGIVGLLIIAWESFLNQKMVPAWLAYTSAGSLFFSLGIVFYYLITGK